MAGQLYLCPYVALAAPTDLNKFPSKTKKGVCKRICKQGYQLCDSWWTIYHGRATPGQFMVGATKTVVYPIGWLATGITWWFTGRDPAGFVLGRTGSIGEGADQFLDHTSYSDAAAYGCPNKKGKGWWSSLMEWIFGDDDDVLEL